MFILKPGLQLEDYRDLVESTVTPELAKATIMKQLAEGRELLIEYPHCSEHRVSLLFGRHK